MKAFIIFTVVVIFLLILINIVYGAEYTDEQIANAIFLAEGGTKAQYAYGIRSVHYEDVAEARQICLNTIRNQRKRHAKHNCELTYLECLANRYCPIGAKNDPKGLNRHWLKNVRFFLTDF